MDAERQKVENKELLAKMREKVDLHLLNGGLDPGFSSMEIHVRIPSFSAVNWNYIKRTGSQHAKAREFSFCN